MHLSIILGKRILLRNLNNLTGKDMKSVSGPSGPTGWFPGCEGTKSISIPCGWDDNPPSQRYPQLFTAIYTPLWTEAYLSVLLQNSSKLHRPVSQLGVQCTIGKRPIYVIFPSPLRITPTVISAVDNTQTKRTDGIRLKMLHFI